MKAMAFGTDGIDGDSSFMCQTQDCYDNPTWGELLADWLEDEGEGFTDIELFRDEWEFVPVGFWLLEDEHAEVIDVIWTAADPGSDSATYSTNRAGKAVAQKLATRTVMSSNQRDLVAYRLYTNGWLVDDELGDRTRGECEIDKQQLRITARFTGDYLDSLTLSSLDQHVQMSFALDEVEMFDRQAALNAINELIEIGNGELAL